MRDLLGLLTRRPFRQSRAAEAEGATHEPEQQSSRARELSGSHATDSARQQEPKPRHDTSVRLRLGAVVFDASLDILTSGSRLFAAMFSGAMRPGAVDDDGALLLDGRDPHHQRMSLIYFDISTCPSYSFMRPCQPHRGSHRHG